MASLRKERVALENIRSAVVYVERNLKIKHALAYQIFKTDGVDLFLEHLGMLVNASQGGQGALRSIMQDRLRRVEYDAGKAARLYLLHREAAPCTVVVDPRRAFGRPVLNGTSVPIAEIVGRFDKGESPKQLAKDYEVTVPEIEEVIRARKAA